jgi:hypothetical protein
MLIKGSHINGAQRGAIMCTRRGDFREKKISRDQAITKYSPSKVHLNIAYAEVNRKYKYFSETLQTEER